MDIEKNKPSVENLKNNHETSDSVMHLTIKETIAKNKEIIEQNHKLLRK